MVLLSLSRFALSPLCVYGVQSVGKWGGEMHEEARMDSVGAELIACRVTNLHPAVAVLLLLCFPPLLPPLRAALLPFLCTPPAAAVVCISGLLSVRYAVDLLCLAPTLFSLAGCGLRGLATGAAAAMMIVVLVYGAPTRRLMRLTMVLLALALWCY